MFQEPALFPWLTRLGNVMFGLKLKPDLSQRARRELPTVSRARRARSILARYVHELSGGMKQRVALARALAPDPKVLLMDEPFAALDAMTRDQLYVDIQRIWGERGKTIVFVTHNVREAVCLGDRVLLMSPRPGRIGREFLVPLPRPRDINSPALAGHAAEIAAALNRVRWKRGRLCLVMKRALHIAIFFCALVALWWLAVASGRWSSVILPSPASVGEYLGRRPGRTLPQAIGVTISACS